MRIYAIADQHGNLELKIPPCDLLIHAGDVCRDFAPRTAIGSDRQLIWFDTKWHDWLARQPVERCIVTWGNHDFIYTKRSHAVAVDETVTVDGVNIWFSPWSKEFNHWAWMKEDADLLAIYDRIPAGTDIIVSHQPPYGYGDTVDVRYLLPGDGGDRHQGSRSLLAAIDRVKPRAVICGHIHSGYGKYARNYLTPETAEAETPDVAATVTIYNVAVVNEDYQLVRGATEIVL